jgi:hypothetical protein
VSRKPEYLRMTCENNKFYQDLLTKTVKYIPEKKVHRKYLYDGKVVS